MPVITNCRIKTSGSERWQTGSTGHFLHFNADLTLNDVAHNYTIMQHSFQCEKLRQNRFVHLVKQCLKSTLLESVRKFVALSYLCPLQGSGNPQLPTSSWEGKAVKRTLAFSSKNAALACFMSGTGGRQIEMVKNTHNPRTMYTNQGPGSHLQYQKLTLDV